MSEIHAITFNKKYYDKESALRWLQKHDIKPRVDHSYMKKTVLWYNITPKQQYKSFITKPITKSINLVIGFKK